MEAAALAVPEIRLAGTLQTILTNAELSHNEKGAKSQEDIVQCFKEANDAGKRLFFDPAARKELPWNDICHSVAIEELHDCYFARCDLQKTMKEPRNRGELFAVYGGKGMGKSYACLSLLAMKHSRSLMRILLFGGN
jgi:hypothetical protein